MENKWETHDFWSQQRKRWHAVAGFPEVLHQCKFRVGIRSDQLTVHSDVLSGCIQIFLRQRFIRTAQINVSCYRAGGLLITLITPGYQINIILRFFLFPDNTSSGFGNMFLYQTALADGVPIGGQLNSQIE